MSAPIGRILEQDANISPHRYNNMAGEVFRPYRRPAKFPDWGLIATPPTPSPRGGTPAA